MFHQQNPSEDIVDFITTDPLRHTSVLGCCGVSLNTSSIVPDIKAQCSCGKNLREQKTQLNHDLNRAIDLMHTRWEALQQSQQRLQKLQSPEAIQSLPLSRDGAKKGDTTPSRTHALDLKQPALLLSSSSSSSSSSAAPVEKEQPAHSKAKDNKSDRVVFSELQSAKNTQALSNRTMVHLCCGNSFHAEDAKSYQPAACIACGVKQPMFVPNRQLNQVVVILDQLTQQIAMLEKQFLKFGLINPALPTTNSTHAMLVPLVNIDGTIRKMQRHLYWNTVDIYLLNRRSALGLNDWRMQFNNHKQVKQLQEQDLKSTQQKVMACLQSITSTDVKTSLELQKMTEALAKKIGENKENAQKSLETTRKKLGAFFRRTAELAEAKALQVDLTQKLEISCRERVSVLEEMTHNARKQLPVKTGPEQQEKDKRLCLAVKYADVGDIKNALDSGADPNIQSLLEDDKREYPLIEVFKHRHANVKDLLELLINAGADVNIRTRMCFECKQDGSFIDSDPNVYSLLTLAIAYGAIVTKSAKAESEYIGVLLHKGARVEMESLAVAIFFRGIHRVELLLPSIPLADVHQMIVDATAVVKKWKNDFAIPEEITKILDAAMVAAAQGLSVRPK